VKKKERVQRKGGLKKKKGKKGGTLGKPYPRKKRITRGNEETHEHHENTRK